MLRSPDDDRETACTAIAVEGDVDTTARAGALTAARVRLGGIPAERARRVTDRGTWGYDELAERAGACRALGGGD